MDIARVLQHLTLTHWKVARDFPPRTLGAIANAITASEVTHLGQIRFVVEGALHSNALWHGQSGRERAIQLFSQLKVWDTEHNTGVLIYLLLADRDVEIVADRGIHARVGEQMWGEICKRMENAFRDGKFEEGITAGIAEIGVLLAEYFPRLMSSSSANELSDEPLVI